MFYQQSKFLYVVVCGSPALRYKRRRRSGGFSLQSGLGGTAGAKHPVMAPKKQINLNFLNCLMVRKRCTRPQNTP